MDKRGTDEARQLLRAAIEAHDEQLYYVASSLAAAYVKDMEAVLRRERERARRD